MSDAITKAIEALDDAKTWHESQDKALSKQPPSSVPLWARVQHQEQIETIAASIAALTALQPSPARDYGKMMKPPADATHCGGYPVNPHDSDSDNNNAPATDDLSAKLAEWEGLANAATPGDWKPGWNGTDYIVQLIPGGCLMVANGWDKEAKANIALAAAAREAIPALIRMVRASEARESDTLDLLGDVDDGFMKAAQRAEARATAAEARVKELEAVLEAGIECTSEHGGAAKFLRLARAALGRQA